MTLTTHDLIDRLQQMYRMSVWSHDGKQYLPMYGYDGQIVAYGRAHEALDLWELAIDRAMDGPTGQSQ